MLADISAAREDEPDNAESGSSWPKPGLNRGKGLG
jgi:hypothetical protein